MNVQNSILNLHAVFSQPLCRRRRRRINFSMLLFFTFKYISNKKRTADEPISAALNSTEINLDTTDKEAWIQK